MSARLPEVDVAIVGFGAAGGVAALPLAEAGLRVTAIEAGDWLTARDYAPDEIRYVSRGWPEVSRKIRGEIPTHRPNALSEAAPQHRHPMMNAVGGTSIHYGAMSWRLNPWDFKVVSETRRRYGHSRLPHGSTVEDWPLDYDELEPYYDLVEYALGVSGQAGRIGSDVDSRGNVLEGPRRRPYPMPPLRSTEFGGILSSAATGLGWHPFPGPAAINSEVYRGRAPCMYHGYCTGGGCPVDAKGSTAVTTIPRALKTGNLEVVTRAHVTTIEVDADGLVKGVRYLRDGAECFQPARVVLLAGYTYENIRLLLLSRSRAFPAGLANNHGQVGRHYFSHAYHAGVLALFPWNIGGWYGLAGQGIGVDDWADDNFDHADRDFIGGGNIWVYSERRPIGAASMHTFDRAPTWGGKWKRFVMTNADRWVTSLIQKTTLPYEHNVVDLDPAVRDPIGRPVCRITADFMPNERRIASFTQDKAEEWFRAAGAVATHRLPMGTMGPTTHAFGGTRMGNDPETSVVDRWGLCHDVPNLGVLGASVMGTSGSKNPTETVQALAWRTADHVVRNWSSLSS